MARVPVLSLLLALLLASCSGARTAAPPHIEDLSLIHILFVVIREYVCNLTDCYISLLINFMDKFLHPHNLITVDDKVNH